MVPGLPGEQREDCRRHRDAEYAERELVQPLRKPQRRHRALPERERDPEDGRAEVVRVAGDQAVHKRVHLQHAEPERHRHRLPDDLAEGRARLRWRPHRPHSGAAERHRAPCQLHQSRRQHRSCHQHDVRTRRKRVGTPERPREDRGGDDRQVEDDGARRSGPEPVMGLEHRTHQRNHAHERHVREQDGHKRGTKRGGLLVRRRPYRNEDHLPKERQRRERHCRAREDKPRHRPRHLGPLRVEPRVDGQEARCERALAEEPTEEVRHHERERERIHRHADAEDARERRIPRKAGDAGQQRQRRDGAGVGLESSCHRWRSRRGRCGYI